MALLLAAAAGCAPGEVADPDARWVGTWSTAVQSPLGPDIEKALKYDPQMGHTLSSAGLDNQTMRMVVHTSVGGKRLRIRLSNLYGTSPLRLGAVSVASRQTGAPASPAVAAGSVRSVLFSGSRSATIAAGGDLTSDPVAMPVAADQDLVVSVFVPAPTGPATWHRVSVATSYLASGDLTADEQGAAYRPVSTPDQSCWFWLAGVEVAGSPARNVLVAFGDSLFDGRRSTLDANHRLPDYLSRRLGATTGVLNMGVAGGRILYDAPCCGASALSRVEHDVLAQPNVSHVLLLEGINDVTWPQMADDITRNPLPIVTAEQVIDGMKRIVAAAHARNVKVIGGTMTPVAGAAVYSVEGEARRQQVNAAIRAGDLFDGVVDFDALMRDADHPDTLMPSYATMDHVHVTDAGYERMANAIDLSLLTR